MLDSDLFKSSLKFFKNKNLPTVKPALLLDFANSKTVDKRITFSRSSTATRFNERGILENVPVNVPRITYDPNTKECLGLLVEETATNMLYASNAFLSMSSWNVRDHISVTTGMPGIGGVLEAYKIQAQAPNALLGQGIFTLMGVTVYGSIYARRRTGNGAIDLIVGEDIAQEVMVPPTGEWVRIHAGGVAIDGVARFHIRIRNAGDELDICYAQLEIDKVSSYIPTVSTTATRASDVAVMTNVNLSNWYNDTQGTFVVSYKNGLNDSYNAVMSMSDESINNHISLISGKNENGNYVEIKSAGNTQAALIGSVPTDFSKFKTAFAYKNDSFAMSENGKPTITDNAGFVPSVTQLRIGSRFSGLGLCGTIENITYYPYRLSDKELQAIATE